MDESLPSKQVAAGSRPVIRSIDYGRFVVALYVRLPLHGASIEGQARFYEEAIMHRITGWYEKDPHGRNAKFGMVVRTACGNSIVALPRTWQPARPCKRCEQMRLEPLLSKKKRGDDFGIIIGQWAESTEYAERWAGLTDQVVPYALDVIMTCQSKRFARIVARGLGFEPPETIVEQFPEALPYVKYLRRPKGVPE